MPTPCDSAIVPVPPIRPASRYGALLGVAKCGGPHVEFQPGRTDAYVFDGPDHLPDPTEPLHANVSNPSATATSVSIKGF